MIKNNNQSVYNVVADKNKHIRYLFFLTKNLNFFMIKKSINFFEKTPFFCLHLKNVYDIIHENKRGLYEQIEINCKFGFDFSSRNMRLFFVSRFNYLKIKLLSNCR